MKTKPIINRNLIRTQVYDYLCQQMKNGNMQPGSIIEAKKLMKDLGVSQTPLREAFLQLQADGFVTIMPQRGVKINALNWEDIKELYEIIGGLESRVMISVFDRIGQSEIEKMKQINEEMLNVNPRKDLHRYYDKNIEFHNVYLNLCNNNRIVILINRHRQILFDFAKRDYGRKWEKDNYLEHLEIIKLIEKGDAKKTAEYIRDKHLTLKTKYQKSL
jgi:DNA-binding GntR family transcriptional regulator